MMRLTKARIDGVFVKDLKVQLDERGKLFEIARMDDPQFVSVYGKSIQQVYLTTANPGIVKAWHYHKKQTDCFCCVAGVMKLVLADTRRNSPTFGCINEFFLGPEAPKIVTIPKEVYHGFMAVSHEPATVINVVTECYNSKEPDEYRKAWDDKEIGYDWTIKNF